MEEGLLTRAQVSNLISMERSYQDRAAERWDHKGKPSVEAELLLLQVYVQEAIEAWKKEPNNVGALHSIRKVVGIGYRALENHGKEAGTTGPVRDGFLGNV